MTQASKNTYTIIPTKWDDTEFHIIDQNEQIQFTASIDAAEDYLCILENGADTPW